MRRSLAILLIITVLFGAGYWYLEVEAVCDVPIAYSVEFVDTRFDISHEEARNAISEAESLWEDATGRNLFTYDETAEFAIRFIYDDRQETTVAEKTLRDELDEREDLSDSVRSKYESLLTNYENLRVLYEERSDAYDEKLKSYNAEVEKWNTRGGAPEHVYENLSEHQQELKAEQESLNHIASELNAVIGAMNRIAGEGNTIVTGYNEIVEEYNERFSEDREFTQGDYQGDYINIYQFDSMEELIVVLIHEFGHALSLPHVEGENSMMYHLMEEQTIEEGFSDADLESFVDVCGDGEFTIWSIFN